MDKRELEHIGRLCQAIATVEQFGTADGKELFGAQSRHIEPRPVAITVANGEVDVLAGEIHVMQSCRHPQVNARILLGKAAKAANQPFGGKIWRGADGENTGALPLEQSFSADCDPIEGIAQDRQVFAAGLSDDQALPLAIEELDA